MLRSGTIVRAGAALAAGGLVLGLSALPAGSQSVGSASLDLTGTATCEVQNGEYVWAVEYSATNTSEINIIGSTPAAIGDIDLGSQVLTLNGQPAGTTDLLPNPVAMGATATDGGPVPGTVTGTLTLTVQWSNADTDSTGTEVFDLVLDDSCHAPATTTTTGAPAVQAVAVTPSFTG